MLFVFVRDEIRACVVSYFILLVIVNMICIYLFILVYFYIFLLYLMCAVCLGVMVHHGLCC